MLAPARNDAARRHHDQRSPVRAVRCRFADDATMTASGSDLSRRHHFRFIAAVVPAMFAIASFASCSPEGPSGVRPCAGTGCPIACPEIIILGPQLLSPIPGSTGVPVAAGHHGSRGKSDRDALNLRRRPPALCASPTARFRRRKPSPIAQPPAPEPAGPLEGIACPILTRANIH